MLDGAAGFICKVAPSHDWGRVTRNRKPRSLPCGSFQSAAPLSPLAQSVIQREQCRSQDSLSSLPWKSHTIISTLYSRLKRLPYSVWEGDTQGHRSQEARVIVVTLCHNYFKAKNVHRKISLGCHPYTQAQEHTVI